ncbi:MAG: DUF4412 domain-containing protein [Acidobacteriota bacterium]
MKWLCRSLSVAFALVLLLSASCLAAEFSADLVIQPKGEEAMKGKIYVKGNKVRHEVTEEGDTQIMIVRPDKKVTWMVVPEEKMYTEIPYQSDDQAFEEWNPEKEKKAKAMGEETIAGFPCKKYETIEDGEKTYVWVAKKLSFPIKLENSEAVMEYKNIKEGSVADSLFELPQGYEKMPQVPGLGGKNDDQE